MAPLLKPDRFGHYLDERAAAQSTQNPGGYLAWLLSRIPVGNRPMSAQYHLLVILYVATAVELDAATLYALLRLRLDVFVVEQRCAYPELDGRDLEPGTRHLWLARHREQPQAYLRLLTENDGSTRIGRICSAVPARGQGLATRLVRAAVDLCPAGGPIILHAQSYLVGYYRRLGFAPAGPEYLDDGIPHTPMRWAG
jgi:ElaA protein